LPPRLFSLLQIGAYNRYRFDPGKPLSSPAKTKDIFSPPHIPSSVCRSSPWLPRFELGQHRPGQVSFREVLFSLLSEVRFFESCFGFSMLWPRFINCGNLSPIPLFPSWLPILGRIQTYNRDQTPYAVLRLRFFFFLRSDPSFHSCFHRPFSFFVLRRLAVQFKACVFLSIAFCRWSAFAPYNSFFPFVVCRCRRAVNCGPTSDRARCVSLRIFASAPGF